MFTNPHHFMGAARHPAMDSVLSKPELIEAILLQLSIRDLLVHA